MLIFLRYSFFNSFLLLQNGSTALHFAASCGKLRFVHELLNHGADPNIPDCVNIFNNSWKLRFDFFCMKKLILKCYAFLYL